MEWKPTATLQSAVSSIFTQAGEEAVRNRDLRIRAKHATLSQRGALGAAPLMATEQAAIDCVREFAREGPSRLLSMMRDVYGDIPAESLAWIREIVQARVRSFAGSLAASLADRRRRAGVKTDGADRRVQQAANAALNDFEVQLATIRVRHEHRQEEMDVFRDMCNDRIKVSKQDGRVFDSVAASVQRGRIHFPDASVPIQEGDLIERPVPGGEPERYVVTDAGFRRGLHGIPDHYQSIVEKDGTAPRRSMRHPELTTIYNVTGPQARINVNSTDASTNILNVDPSTLFTAMRDATSAAELPDQSRDELIRRIEAMEAESTQRSFAKRYVEFVGVAADHLQVFGPFLPALAQLLARVSGS